MILMYLHNWQLLIYNKRPRFQFTLNIITFPSYPQRIMNRNFIFVFILLATISIVYAIPHKLLKRETAFGICESESRVKYPPVPLTVKKMSPDPVIPGKPDTFIVSGTLRGDMPKKTRLLVFFTDPNRNNQTVGDVFS